MLNIRTVWELIDYLNEKSWWDMDLLIDMVNHKWNKIWISEVYKWINCNKIIIKTEKY